MWAPARDWDPRLRVGAAIVLVGILLATAFAYGRKLDRRMSAFVRWQPQVQALLDGEDVYRAHEYPNPPLMGLLLYPLAALPVEVGAWLWFGLKVVLAAAAVAWAVEAVAPRGPPLGAPWVLAGIALSLRPILSDLQHANVNILILFLVMAGLRALQHGRDATAGVWVGLATCLKITPALLVVYFAWKRWWRACAAFGVAVVVLSFTPALVLGFGHTAELLVSYYEVMLEPFSTEGAVEVTLAANQSLGAVLQRFLTDAPAAALRTGEVSVGLAVLDVEAVRVLLRGLSVTLLVGLAWVCRSPGEPRGLRIASEYALVLIAMLLISPRTWKHHYVVMALPYLCVLAWAARGAWQRQRVLLGAVVLSQLLVLSTSKEFARIVWFVDEAHVWAQALGAFLFSGILVMVVLAGVLVAARGRAPSEASEPVAARS